MLGLTEKSGDIMRTVDKLDKIGAEKVRAMLVDDCGVERRTGGRDSDVHRHPRHERGGARRARAVPRQKRDLRPGPATSSRPSTKYLGAFGVPEENFAVDLTIARGLDYYTGTVYETTLLDHPEIGSVCSGGRYDNLAEYYTDRKLPGVGISIGVTRLFYVLGEQGLLNERHLHRAGGRAHPADDRGSERGYLARDSTCAPRASASQIYTEKKKFKAKMNYADKLKVPYVYFLGEDEINAGVVSCKDMRTGEQVKLPRAEAVEKAKAFVEGDKRKPVILEKK